LTIKTNAYAYNKSYMKLLDAIKITKQFQWFAIIASLNQIKNKYFPSSINNRITFNKSERRYFITIVVNVFLL
jgi:hypothetical protein